MAAEIHSNWHNKPEVIKGDLGEEIFDKRLKQKGFKIYIPEDLDTPHPIDRLYLHPQSFDLFMVDVKCKELRWKYNDTGFPKRNLRKYMEINKKIEVLIYFIDYEKGEIYGNTLTKLLENELNIYCGIIYFKYEHMDVMGKLTGEEIKQIREAKNEINKTHKKRTH